MHPKKSKPRPSASRRVTYKDWIALSASDKRKLMHTWDPYGPGYWWSLVKTAARRFRKKFDDSTRYESIGYGCLQGGTIAICVSLKEDTLSDLPRDFEGFHIRVHGPPIKNWKPPTLTAGYRQSPFYKSLVTEFNRIKKQIEAGGRSRKPRARHTEPSK